MRLIVLVPHDEYELVTGSDVIVGAVDSVEIVQADGLLTEERVPLLIEGVSLMAATELGVAHGGSAIRVYTTQKEASDG